MSINVRKVTIPGAGIPVLRPLDMLADGVKLAKVPDNTALSISIVSKRNVERNAKLWAIIDMLFDNLPEIYECKFATKYALQKWLLCKVGWCEDANGLPMPKDTNFADLKSEDTFNDRVFQPCLQYIAEMLQVTAEELDGMSNDHRKHKDV